ncbi:MAG: hypothetical protein WED87_04820 [Dehalococcoidia bacterium]
MADLTKDQLADLESARNNLYALRDWPQTRLKWIAAIRARQEVLGMSPRAAYEKLLARDRIYERARETVTTLMLKITGPRSP